ncbi:MAG: IPTL-CTERM sorting domain-containing protein [Burkholderiales bacterium]
MASHAHRSSRGRAARFIVRPLFAALVAAGVAAPSGIHAATIVVTTGGDAGTAATCTLRQAVAAMNAASVAGTSCVNSGGIFGSFDKVDLSTQSGTITLQGAAEIGITGYYLLVDGPGAAALTVSGANASRVFHQTNPGGVLVVQDLTVANGRSSGAGGCILSEGLGLHLLQSVVTGCTALPDPTNTSFLDGIGGGVAANYLNLGYSTVSGNTAEIAGGGVFAKYANVRGSAISGNTVTGRACTVASSSKYCLPLLFGGGGMVVGSAQLVHTTVSGNTVNASSITGAGPPGTYNFGVGGGITQINKYTPEVAAAAAKAGIAGRGGDAAGRAAARAALRASAGAKSLTRAKGGARAKADGYGNYIIALYASTVSGNRVVGNGQNPGKYAGGGIVAYSEYYTAEIANSTISGNRLPSPGGPDPYPTFGAALFADSAEISNSTITGNAGTVAVAFKYNTNPVAAVANAKSAGAKGAIAIDRLRAKAAQWRGAGAKAAVAKASGPSALQSTIVGGNAALYDLACISGPGCTIGGSNNLVEKPDASATLPGDTITGQNPQLAPLANNGGVVAGAPGHALTGPVPTHRLYFGSPAIDTGANPEGFAYEQRGEGFPRVAGPAADIGATEGSVPRPVNVPVPVLGPWTLGLLSALLGALGLARRRRRS